jgi:hypothetical protein
MAKRKLYGAALAAHQKKARKDAKKGGKVSGMNAAERAYWAEYRRQMPAQAKAAKKEPDLTPYPTPEVLHREINYYRPLTPAQKKAQKSYESWLASKPKEYSAPMTKEQRAEEAKRKRDAGFKAAYERWEARRPRAAIYSLPAGSR